MNNTANWKLRLFASNPRHTRFALFDPKGANCGELTIESEDVDSFLALFWHGSVESRAGHALGTTQKENKDG